MRQESHVEELLLRWEEAQAGGQILSAEELCRDCPEYRDELARRIRALQAMHQVLGSAETGPDRPRAVSVSERGQQANSDYNLLFGILAVQMDCISRDALIAAMHAWVLDKSKPLAQILVEQGALTLRARQKLDAVVALHLEMHQGDPHQSLAAVRSIGSVRQALQEVADAELHASLVHVATARADEDPWATQPASVGQPSVPGVRFRILHKHAEGGLGAVFVAHDEELHRQVALKEIKGRFAHHAESRTRFLLEAQVTGGLEHPGVVPVYGLGCYADGRPFYAMRFIKGDSLRDAIQRFHAADAGRRDPGERSLAFRELLGRFVDACNALAYAHARGILHRDVKPHNIMLGKYGETLVVDWGLAKVIGHHDGIPGSDEGTLRPCSGQDTAPTQAGAVMGTPAYMSPEQATGQLDQLGPASDIYSLGATLYELLTGTAPVHGQHVGEILARVKQGSWLRPRQVKTSVPKALEAVCRKAMARQPAERYATALLLAQDVEHWLADEPVAAYHEPWPARMRRWSRRHRPLVVGVAALLLAAVPLALVIAVDREQARQRAEADKEEIARQKDLALANEQAATAREAETKAVLDFVENKIFAAARPEGQEGGLGHEVTLRRAVEAALPYVAKSFTDQPLIEARLRLTLGNSFFDLGDAKTAAEQYEAARALCARHQGPDHPDTLESMMGLANCYDVLGRFADAIKLHEQTLELRTVKLGRNHVDTLKSMMWLAVSYDDAGRYADALKLCEETVTLRKAKLGPDHPDTLFSMMGLAVGYERFGRLAEALKLQEETLARQRAKLGPAHPDILWNMNNLAATYGRLGRYADALKLNEETLALRKTKLGPDHPDTLWSMRTLSDTYADLGRHADALKLREEALPLHKAKLGPEHPHTFWSMIRLANSYAAVGRHAEALKLYEETLALQKTKLGSDHLDTLRCMRDLANTYADLGRHTDALKLREETFALMKAKLGPDDPQTLWCMGSLASSYSTLGRQADALKLLEEKLALQKAKLGSDHADTLTTLGQLASSYATLGQLKESEQSYQDLEQHYQKAVDRDPSDHWNWHQEAPLRLRKGDLAGYRRVCQEMLARFSQTDKPEIADRTAKTCLLQPGAVSDLGPVRQLAERAVAGTEQHIYYPYFLLTQGMSDYRAGDFLNAIARLNKTLSLVRDTRHDPALAGTAHVFLAMAHHQVSQAIEARRALDQAAYLMDQGRSNDWADWLRFRLVYREAEVLVREKAEALK